MKILRLAHNAINPAVAVAKIDVRKDEKLLRFMVTHGSFGKDTWGMNFHITNNLGLPKNKDDKLVLKENNYTFKAVIDRTKGKPIMDKAGNKLFTISKSKDYDSLDNDQIVLWSIPVGIYTDVKYTITGSVTEVAKGINGKWLLDKFYTAPAPVLSIFGNCTLEWDAKDVRKGILHKQVITYDEIKGWQINGVHTEEIQDIVNV